MLSGNRWCAWKYPQRLGKRAGRIGNRKTDRDYPNYSTVEVGQKSPGDLRKLAFTQTQVKAIC